jgi:hypothetical protein
MGVAREAAVDDAPAQGDRARLGRPAARPRPAVDARRLLLAVAWRILGV